MNKMIKTFLNLLLTAEIELSATTDLAGRPSVCVLFIEEKP